MKNDDLIKILDKISYLIKEREYETAQHYIEESKITIMAQDNTLNNYIDSIIGELR